MQPENGPLSSPLALYRGRRAARIENDAVRVTVLVEGGHIAEIVDKQVAINPLWTPPWPSIEPSSYDADRTPGYGENAESKLLAGIMGHNLCLDLFGGPSEAEATAGITVHGEASIATYQIRTNSDELIATADLPLAGLAFERRIRLNGNAVDVTEIVTNQTGLDRPLAWTQHVTIGPPFLIPGETEFTISATQSRTYESEFGNLYPQGKDFQWPFAPSSSGERSDLRSYPGGAPSAGYTAHLMDPALEQVFFLARTRSLGVEFGYRWKRADFPWLGMWIENRSRTALPWGGNTVACGLEFGVSPMPETRRQMIERRSLFGVPAYRWLEARSQVSVKYSAHVGPIS